MDRSAVNSMRCIQDSFSSNIFFFCTNFWQDKIQTAPPIAESVPIVQQPDISSPTVTHPRVAPSEVLRDFQNYQQMKRQHRSQAAVLHDTSFASLNTGLTNADYSIHNNSMTVRGILSQYAPRDGTQLYRDLAGNIRQVSSKNWDD